MKFNSIKVRLILCFMLLTGCDMMCSKDRTEMTPEEVVEAYLDLSLNMRNIEQKQYLINLTTGSLRGAIEKASDETIRKAFLNRYYHLEAYSVVERRDRTPRETEITFVLTYRDLGPAGEIKPQDAPQVLTENTVSVVRLKGAWAIRDVLGKRTTIDFPTSQGAVVQPTQER